MKKIAIFIISFFVLQTGLCFSQANDKDREKRKGYEKLYVIEYLYDDDDTEAHISYSIDIVEYIEYDNNGNILTQIKYDEAFSYDGCDKHINYYKYDDNNNLIEEEYYIYEYKSDSVSMKQYRQLIYENKYNSANQLVEILRQSYTNPDFNTKISKKYGEKGVMIEQIFEYIADPSDEGYYKSVSKFDNKGNITSFVLYGKNNTITRENATTNKYDYNNRLISKSEDKSTTTYTYDKNGNVLTEKTTTKDGQRYYSYKYNAKGLLVEATNHNLEKKTFYKYKK